MDSPQPDVRLQESLARYGRAAVTVALAVAALDWVGWTCGIEPLTRINRAWPQMMPWTALWLAALAAAIAAQSGRPSRARVWAGRGLAVAVGILAAVVLAEYATGRSFGLDEVWFTETVRALHWSWPGRPSSPTALAVLPVAAAVALMRLDRGTSGAWAVCVAAGGTIAFVSVAAYLFDAVSLVGVTPSRGQSISTALTLLLLVTASAAARPDRFPFAWLLARPDRRSLVRLLGILAGFPVVVALSRATFLAVGVGEPTEWSLSIVVGTLIAGAVTFYLSQREQRLLIEKELVSKKRADAEARYRILADNAVDVIVHLRGSEVAWISPSVEAALGGPPQQWIGADPSRRIHADDVDAVVAALGGIAGGGSVLRRFRVRSADGDAYHWVDSHAKPYVDAEGNTDGVIAAPRVRAAPGTDPGRTPGHPVLRHRPLQGHQRHVGRRRRRRRAHHSGGPDPRLRPRRRHRRPDGRRRDPRPAARRQERRRARPDRREDSLACRRTDSRIRLHDLRDPEHRCHHGRARRGGLVAHGPGRRGDVPGQTGRPEHRRPHLSGRGTAIR